jgi:hypothetical protein
VQAQGVAVMGGGGKLACSLAEYQPPEHWSLIERMKKSYNDRHSNPCMVCFLLSFLLALEALR